MLGVHFFMFYFHKYLYTSLPTIGTYMMMYKLGNTRHVQVSQELGGSGACQNQFCVCLDKRDTHSLELSDTDCIL